MSVQRFRKKPVDVEAWRWDGTEDGATPIIEWITHQSGGRADLCAWPFDKTNTAYTIAIHTLEGVMNAFPGDWIIRGVEGEFYPCRHSIFAATYMKVVPGPGVFKDTYEAVD